MGSPRNGYITLASIRKAMCEASIAFFYETVTPCRVSLEFITFCQEHKIIPLCLPPHTTHRLQPLDVGVFGFLAKRYKALVSEEALFGCQRINNLQFLQIYQKAREDIRHNIPSALGGLG